MEEEHIFEEFHIACADQSALQPLWLILGIICKCLEKTSLVLWGRCHTHSYAHTDTHAVSLCILLRLVITEEMHN